MTTHESLGDFTVEQLVDGLKRAHRDLPQLFEDDDDEDFNY